MQLIHSDCHHFIISYNCSGGRVRNRTECQNSVESKFDLHPKAVVDLKMQNSLERDNPEAKRKRLSNYKLCCYRRTSTLHLQVIFFFSSLCMKQLPWSVSSRCQNITSPLNILSRSKNRKLKTPRSDWCGTGVKVWTSKCLWLSVREERVILTCRLNFEV